MNQPIIVGDRRIGPGAPVFLAAEAGLNHDGDLGLAHRLIDLAAEAGADGIKFQNYRTEDFLTDHTLRWSYEVAGQTVEESQFEMFKRCELRPEWIGELATHCRQAGLVFFSTPTNTEGIRDLVRAGSLLLKNGSDFLQNLPLIRAMAATGLPTVLSTGMANLTEIDEAVRAFREGGGRDLILLHCTSAYPTPPRESHLRKITSLQAAFGCPVGLSDHSEGIVNAIAATVLGACFIEKHFTYDRNAPGPDHRFSSDAGEFKALVQAVRHAEAALGEAAIGHAAIEKDARLGYRLSCVAAGDLPEGTVLTAEALAFRRPGTGLPPAFADFLVGRRLARKLEAGSQIQLADLR
jgi:N-acetylneuraminate synthase/N,N'-diacetyllegionaminate synthase